MKKTTRDMILNTLAAMLFQFDIDWDEELPALAEDKPARPAIEIAHREEIAYIADSAAS